MTKHLKFSKRLHWATLCCFLLPFFYTGCGLSSEEKARAEKSKQDSIAAATVNVNNTLIKPADTTIQNNIPQKDTSNTQVSIVHPDTTTSKSEKESKSPSEKISTKFEFLRPLLIPKEDTYTGLATVIDSVPFICFFSVFICLLFLVISLTVKFIDLSARKTIVLLDTFASIFFFIARPYSWDSEKLWGYWVALAFITVLTIYDFYIIKLSRARK